MSLCQEECARAFPERGYIYDTCVGVCNGNTQPQSLGASVMSRDRHLVDGLLVLVGVGLVAWGVTKIKK